MKKCIVVGEGNKFGPIPIKGDLKETLPLVSKLGYEYVELNLNFPFTLKTIELKDILLENNLKVSAITTGYPYFSEGISFTSQTQESRKKTVQIIKEYVDLANILETQVVIGSIRGNGNREHDYQNFIKCLKELLIKAEQKNVNILLEPINRYETKLINTVDEGLEIIKKVNSKKLKLLLDTFHMNIEEKSIYESIKKANELIYHFHVADSNRKPMGCGHLNFNAIFKTLTEISYTKAVSAELVPFSNQKETVDLITGFFKENYYINS